MPRREIFLLTVKGERARPGLTAALTVRASLSGSEPRRLAPPRRPLMASQNHGRLHTRCSQPAPGSTQANARVDGDQISPFYHPRAGAALACSLAREVGDVVVALPTWRAGPRARRAVL